MKCQWCVEKGERSTLTPLGYAVTAMPTRSFYDEDGNYHFHDPNHASGGLYECSLGHRFWAATSGSCRSCSYRPSEARLDSIRCEASGRSVGHLAVPGVR